MQIHIALLVSFVQLTGPARATSAARIRLNVVPQFH
jgi:hypothetical protein